MTAPGWPATPRYGDVGLRPLRMRDALGWSEARTRNETWLSRWEGAPPGPSPGPWPDRHTPAAFAAMLRVLRREARAGRALPFAVVLSGRMVGQLTVSTVVRGAYQSASIGYWIDEQAAGRGVMPTAVALAVDHCFGPVGLHRVEVSIRPENASSLRVVDKLGFRQEGRHDRMLYIDGQWRDHLCFALTAEDVPGGLLRRYTAR